jgi:outer membrane protease
MRLSWSGRDGFIQYPPFDFFEDYPPWDASLPKDSEGLTGEVIRYTQNWFILAPGFSLKWRITNAFSLLGNFNFTPLIFCSARDDHVKRNLTFHDYLSFGHYYKASGELFFSPVKKLDLSFRLSYTYITRTRGVTYVDSVRLMENAGAGLSAMDLRLAARIHISGRN